MSTKLCYRYINAKMHISMHAYHISTFHLFSKPLFLCKVMGMLEISLGVIQNVTSMGDMHAI